MLRLPFLRNRLPGWLADAVFRGEAGIELRQNLHGLEIQAIDV
jgi:hypothetical protein